MRGSTGADVGGLTLLPMPDGLPERADVVVLGAGCAGLSLAVRLVGSGRRVVLVDPRTAWERDRTWCFFTGTEHPFAHLPTATWSRWTVRAGGRAVDCAAPGLAYAHLPADVFYRDARARLDDPRVSVHPGVAARAVVEREDHVEVRLDGGATVRAEVVVDTRPPDLLAPPDPRWARLLQHFEGWHVHTERPVFDPGAVTLMDFDVPAGPGVRFLYVLPFSPTEALVEDTHFSPHPQADYAGLLRSWLDARAGPGGWRVDWRERGALPMTVAPFPARPSLRVHRLGLGGGAARPATGYAFLAIQRAADALAHQLRVDPLGAVPPFRRARTEWLDGVFLEWLAGAPEMGPEAFFTMFSHAAPARVARFLSETAGLLDDLAVVTALARRVRRPIADAALRYSRRARSRPLTAGAASESS